MFILDDSSSRRAISGRVVAVEDLLQEWYICVLNNLNTTGVWNMQHPPPFTSYHRLNSFVIPYSAFRFSFQDAGNLSGCCSSFRKQRPVNLWSLISQRGVFFLFFSLFGLASGSSCAHSRNSTVVSSWMHILIPPPPTKNVLRSVKCGRITLGGGKLERRTTEVLQVYESVT